MSDSMSKNEREVLRHPLRGLASDGAEPAVRKALADLRGILSVELTLGHAVAQVTFDPRCVSAQEVRDRLRMAGVRKDFREDRETDVS